MSDTTTDLDSTTESTPDVDATVPEGTPEVGDTQVATEASTEPAAETIEIEGIGQVTLEELRKGYLRQSDYTKKTQQVAEERKRLAQAEAILAALEADPASTLTELQRAFGINAAAQNPQAETDTDDEWVDPDDLRLRRIEQWMEEQADRERQAQIDREIDGLRQRFGDFDVEAVLEHAVRNNLPSLEAAYAHMNFADTWAKATEAQKRAAAEAAALEAKREAQIVETGGSTAAGAVAPAPRPMSVKEAWRAAMQTLSG